MAIDKSRFGTGYISNLEKGEKFVFVGSEEFDEKGGGGAVPIRDYDGPWPVFGKETDGWEHKSEVMHNSTVDPSSSSSGSSSSSPPVRRPRWMCKSKGGCSACPSKELHRPYCQPYGNRAPIECRPVIVIPAATKPEPHFTPPPGTGTATREKVARGAAMEGESDWRGQPFSKRQETVIGGDVYKGYQICGKDQAKESWDFGEFVTFNLVFALVALFIFLHRQRFLAGQHQSMLARRIGRH